MDIGSVFSGIFPSTNKKNVPVTPKIVNAVNVAGNGAADAVKQSGELVQKFQELVEKVDSAAKALDEKAPEIASVIAQNSGPIQEAVNNNAKALAPMMGGANVAMLGGMPKSMISAAASRMIKQAAQKWRAVSQSIKKTIKSLKGGFRHVGGVLNKAKKNVRSTVKNVPVMVGGVSMLASNNGFKLPKMSAPNMGPVGNAVEKALTNVSNAASNAGKMVRNSAKSAANSVSNTVKNISKRVGMAGGKKSRSRSSRRSSRKNRKNNRK